MPERNRGDLDEVPEEVKKELDFVFASRMDQVIEAALEERPVSRVKPTSPPVPVAVA